MKIQYLGKKPSMVSGTYIFEGDVRDVSENLARQLVDESPDDYRIISKTGVESDDQKDKKKPSKNKAKKNTTVKKKTVSKETESDDEQSLFEEPL